MQENREGRMETIIYDTGIIGKLKIKGNQREIREIAFLRDPLPLRLLRGKQSPRRRRTGLHPEQPELRRSCPRPEEGLPADSGIPGRRAGGIHLSHSHGRNPLPGRSVVCHAGHPLRRNPHLPGNCRSRRQSQSLAGGGHCGEPQPTAAGDSLPPSHRIQGPADGVQRRAGH